MADLYRQPPTAPQNETPSDPQADLSSQLIALLEQTNRLLGELISLLRRGGGPSPAPAPRPAPQNAAAPQRSTAPAGATRANKWVELVNRAFTQPTPADVRAYLQAILAQVGVEPLIVDFDDRGEYQQDRSYARFSCHSTGCCFLLPLYDDPNVFAAFPYPTGPTWFLLGKDGLRALYDISGSQQSLAPRLELIKPATMRRTGAVNGSGSAIFVPLQRGEMIAKSTDAG